MCARVTEESLEASLLDFIDESEKKEVHDFFDSERKITSKEEANYFIRKIKEMNSSIASINETADSEIKKQTERINTWRDQTTKSYSFLIQEYTSFLRDFWIENGNDKTMKLSHGSLCMRKMKDKEEYDADILDNFLEQNALYQYTNRVPNKAKIKENITVDENGFAFLNIDNHHQIKVEGLKYIKQEPKFEVK